jgi:hypothetical protein
MLSLSEVDMPGFGQTLKSLDVGKTPNNEFFFVKAIFQISRNRCFVLPVFDVLLMNMCVLFITANIGSSSRACAVWELKVSPTNLCFSSVKIINLSLCLPFLVALLLFIDVEMWVMLTHE